MNKINKNRELLVLYKLFVVLYSFIAQAGYLLYSYNGVVLKKSFLYYIKIKQVFINKSNNI